MACETGLRPLSWQRKLQVALIMVLLDPWQCTNTLLVEKDLKNAFTPACSAVALSWLWYGMVPSSHKSSVDMLWFQPCSAAAAIPQKTERRDLEKKKQGQLHSDSLVGHIHTATPIQPAVLEFTQCATNAGISAHKNISTHYKHEGSHHLSQSRVSPSWTANHQCRLCIGREWKRPLSPCLFPGSQVSRESCSKVFIRSLKYMRSVGTLPMDF